MDSWFISTNKCETLTAAKCNTSNTNLLMSSNVYMLFLYLCQHWPASKSFHISLDVFPQGKHVAPSEMAISDVRRHGSSGSPSGFLKKPL